MSWRWPVELTHELPSGERLTLRPLVRGDREQWDALRARNRAWLGRWESTVPGEQGAPLPFYRLRRALDRTGREGYGLPLVIDIDGRLVGQVQLFDLLWGARRSGSVGYWLGEASTGRGYATWAVAALVDHALLAAGVHRVEVTIRPENYASLRVAERLGLPGEGMARGLMHVDGAWRDHRTFAVLAEDLRPGGYAPGGLVARLGQRR